MWYTSRCAEPETKMVRCTTGGSKGSCSVDKGHACSGDSKAAGGCSEREAEFCWEHCLNHHQLNDAAANAKEKLMEIHESIAKDRKKGILRGTAQHFLRKMLPVVAAAAEAGAAAAATAAAAAAAGAAATTAQQQQHSSSNSSSTSNSSCV
jgi:hypothetical protein